jgi:predicted 3-demethylubiquinone-9 3-methyltransferase (glyoxalase superfamily)/uncharacterized protein YndB with AHSA1/START domain
MKTIKEQQIVTVQTRIDAPLELVWKLWNTPVDIIMWNTAREDWHSPKAVNDLRVGGRFRIRMEAIDGSQGFDFSGVYDKVVPLEEISYTLDDGRKATVMFYRNNGKSRIVETFEPEKENPVEVQHDGWQAILDNFKRYAEVRSAFSKPPRISHVITPCLWFDHNAEEAVNFYVSVFRNSKILNKTYYSREGYDIHHMKEGTLLTIDFQINGQPFTALNGGPEFKYSEAISFQVLCETQEEIDYYWLRLCEGGEEGQCGWLKDKYGVSWQIAPSILPKLLSNPAKAERVMHELMPMKKLIIDRLKNA